MTEINVIPHRGQVCERFLRSNLKLAGGKSRLLRRKNCLAIPQGYTRWYDVNPSSTLTHNILVYNLHEFKHWRCVSKNNQGKKARGPNCRIKRSDFLVDEDEGSPSQGGDKFNIVEPKSRDQRKPSGSVTFRSFPSKFNVAYKHIGKLVFQNRSKWQKSVPGSKCKVSNVPVSRDTH